MMTSTGRHGLRQSSRQYLVSQLAVTVPSQGKTRKPEPQCCYGYLEAYRIYSNDSTKRLLNFFSAIYSIKSS